MSGIQLSRGQSKTLVKDLTEGSVAKQLVVFAAPLFLSNLLQVVYNMVDMVVVGQIVGSTGLSAVAIGGDIVNFLTFIAIGFSGAAQVIVAQYIGAEQREKLGKFIGTMFTFLISTALVVSIVCLGLRSPMLRLMNTPFESWDQALDYATICITGLIFIYGYNIVGAILRGMGNAKHPFVFISIAAILNVVLDIWFVAGLGLEAFGAALATVVSQAVSFTCGIVFLWRNRARLGFELRRADFRIDTEMLTTLVRLGIPMAIRSASIQFSKLFVNSWINSYGVVVSAVAGIGNKFNNISNLVANSVATAGASMVGQSIGAEKYGRVSQILRVALTITLSLSAVMILALLMAPEAIFGFFTSDTSILGVAMEYLPVGVLVFVGSALRGGVNALINGSGNYRVNFAVAIIDGMLCRIGLALLLGLVVGMEYLGFWYGDALASLVPFFIGVVYYFSGNWKTRKHVIRNEA